ncbi:MAG: ATP-binding protein, partial [Desulfatirhabdiaceae bacterium]
IAHELNNPINNIHLTAETILEDYDSVPPAEGKELIGDILSQAERAGDIIKNLLDFSRSEMPVFTELNIRDVLQKTLKLVKNQIMLTGISVEIDISEDIPVIQGNFRNLEQIFLNLLINAIQALSEGGHITIRALQDSDQFILIDIADNGTGIKPEDLDHIFDPFYTTKAVGHGTGLGLAVSYALVKKHGGHIEVKSRVKAGTTVSVYLPVTRPAESNNGVTI